MANAFGLKTSCFAITKTFAYVKYASILCFACAPFLAPKWIRSLGCATRNPRCSHPYGVKCQRILSFPKALFYSLAALRIKKLSFSLRRIGELVFSEVTLEVLTMMLEKRVWKLFVSAFPNEVRFGTVFFPSKLRQTRLRAEWRSPCNGFARDLKRDCGVNFSALAPWFGV